MSLFKNLKSLSNQHIEDATRTQMLTALSVKYETSRSKVISDLLLETNRSLIRHLAALWVVVLCLVGYQIVTVIDFSVVNDLFKV